LVLVTTELPDAIDDLTVEFAGVVS
jgi:hypothetical protein